VTETPILYKKKEKNSNTEGYKLLWSQKKRDVREGHRGPEHRRAQEPKGRGVCFTDVYPYGCRGGKCAAGAQGAVKHAQSQGKKKTGKCSKR